MIELIASGPVAYRTDDRVRKEDGHDEIRGRVTTGREEVVEVDLEFPQGHVNLDGYAPSAVGSFGPIGSVERYLPEGADPIGDEWTVELRGEWFDWVQQAHRYMTERPDESLVSCLETFRGWDEVDSEQISTAMMKLSGVTVADKSNLCAAGWDLLREELNDLDEVQIPESYS